jgi:hypothetical protein
MKRLAAIVMMLSLGLAACAHDHAFARSDVAAMRNNSPAISPWSEPVPGDALQSTRGPRDEN